jgi:hypothetical protein
MLVVDGMLTLLPVTVSSLSIALVLLVLLGRHGVRAAWAFVAGWFAASWLVLLLGMLGVSGLADRAGGTAPGLPPLVQVGVGVAAVASGGARPPARSWPGWPGSPTGSPRCARRCWGSPWSR